MRSLLYLTLCLASLIVAGCEHDSTSTSCSVKDPVTQLPWLANMIEDIETSQDDVNIYQAEYNSKTIFLFFTCCLTCNTMIPIYDCSGKKILEISGTHPDEIKNQHLIWKLPTSACNN